MYDTTPKTRRYYCPIAIIAGGIAALVMLHGDLIGSARIFGVGLIVFLIAATTLVTLRTGVNTEIVEIARQGGYDAGYQDGRDVAPADVAHLRAVVI